MKFRFHRGSLAASMATTVEFNNRFDLEKIIVDKLGDTPFFPENPEIVVKPYGFDKRIEWDSHIVHLAGWGPVGFTDGPVT